MHWALLVEYIIHLSVLILTPQIYLLFQHEGHTIYTALAFLLTTVTIALIEH